MQAIIQTLYAEPTMAWLLSLLFKSSIVIAVSGLLIFSVRRHISSALAHLLWAAGLAIVAILPIAEFLRSLLAEYNSSLGGISLFTIDASLEQSTIGQSSEMASLFIIAYSVVALTGMLSIAYAALQLWKLNSDSKPLLDNTHMATFSRLCEALEIKRPVELKVSELVDSPISYGFFKPVVLLPQTATHWETETIEQVLLHELSHINRRDWLTLLCSKILCVMLWANPLVWLASKQLHEEAEQACDSVVAAHGKSRTNYAENLLNLAKQRRSNTNDQTGHWQMTLAQTMFGKHELSNRITNILEGRIVTRLGKGLKLTLSGLVLITTAAFSTVHLLAADSGLTDQDYLPTRAIAPLYPTRAAEEGIEGWTLVSFTVQADGRVDPNSISVLDAEPPGYFENNSRSAAARFEFDPRVVDGIAVDVPGVQYLFRYQLSEGSGEFSRPPPEANAR